MFSGLTCAQIEGTHREDSSSATVARNSSNKIAVSGECIGKINNSSAQAAPDG